MIFLGQCPSVANDVTVLELSDNNSSSCYLLHNDSSSHASRDEADAFCLTQYNGSLAQMTSQSERELLSGHLSDDVTEVWLGAREYFTDWQWHTTAPAASSDVIDVTYSAWKSNSLYDAYRPRAVCGVVDRRDGGWTKWPCENVLQFICQLGWC